MNYKDRRKRVVFPSPIFWYIVKFSECTSDYGICDVTDDVSIVTTDVSGTTPREFHSGRS